jgi:sugar phosphate isomerase/epimerase
MKYRQKSQLIKPLTLKRLGINQATTRTGWNHRESLLGYAKYDIKHIGLWRDKVLELGVKETKILLNELGSKVTCLNRIGPVFASDGEADATFLEDAKCGIDEAVGLNAESLMYFPGTSLPNNINLDSARQHAKDCLQKILELARPANVKIVIEPLHPMIAGDRSCLNTIAQCNDICDDLGGGLGIVVDVYHVWWDPMLKAEIFRAGAARLAGFHINDWLVPTTDLFSGRGMMGDGVIELGKIRGWMEQAGYRGSVEIEIFSEWWWRKNPDDVIKLAIERALQFG